AVTARPTCDVVFDVNNFTEGGPPPVVKLIRLSNHDAQPATVEFKLWLRVPGGGPLPLVNGGADYTVQLPPHRDLDHSNVPLFTVGPSTRRGTYELACVLSSPVTGEIFGRWLDTFSVR